MGASKRGVPIALLTTTGRRSGRPQTVPLMYLEDGGRFLVVASNAGFDHPPAWFRNLDSRPEATFEPGGDQVPVRARIVDDDERARLWPRLVAHNPLWAGFQSHTDRPTAVVSLEPTS